MQNRSSLFSHLFVNVNFSLDFWKQSDLSSLPNLRTIFELSGSFKDFLRYVYVCFFNTFLKHSPLLLSSIVQCYLQTKYNLQELLIFWEVVYIMNAMRRLFLWMFIDQEWSRMRADRQKRLICPFFASADQDLAQHLSADQDLAGSHPQTAAHLSNSASQRNPNSVSQGQQIDERPTRQI